MILINKKNAANYLPETSEDRQVHFSDDGYNTFELIANRNQYYLKNTFELEKLTKLLNVCIL